ncbi:MAG: hypothetical protein U5Q44_06045 [Dehalococcoidia bacterium]|nr:hypothetical protein [Dehalococcoidia bacterium]
MEGYADVLRSVPAGRGGDAGTRGRAVLGRRAGPWSSAGGTRSSRGVAVAAGRHVRRGGRGSLSPEEYEKRRAMVIDQLETQPADFKPAEIPGVMHPDASPEAKAALERELQESHPQGSAGHGAGVAGGGLAGCAARNRRPDRP